MTAWSVWTETGFRCGRPHDLHRPNITGCGELVRSGSSNRQCLERRLRKEAARGPDMKGKTPSQAHNYSLGTLKTEVGGLAYKGQTALHSKLKDSLDI